MNPVAAHRTHRKCETNPPPAHHHLTACRQMTARRQSAGRSSPEYRPQSAPGPRGADGPPECLYRSVRIGHYRSHNLIRMKKG